LRANAIYQYRSVSEEEARQVFLVQERHFRNGILQLMKDDGKFIGFYGLTHWKENDGKETNILSHFFLEPEFIGKGYGKILFREVIRAAKEELNWEGFLWESDPHAAWFYKKMGARQIGENPCPLNPKYKAPVFVFTF
jgi:GNAT superfamily N-acetyltransferase